MFDELDEDVTFKQDLLHFNLWDYVYQWPPLKYILIEAREGSKEGSLMNSYYKYTEEQVQLL